MSARPTTSPAEETAHQMRASIHDELACIIHDLKSPLATVSLHAELLRARSDTSSRRALEVIRENIGYMDRMIRGLLDISRRNGQLDLKVRPAPLAMVIDAVVERTVSAGESARIGVEVRDDVHAVINADRIERVVQNLVDNALKYSPASSPILIRLEAVAERARVSVIDGGPGLSEQERASVFERFRRGDRVEQFEGSGLGLYACRTIVEQHGGRIDVESVEGQGSQFFFELPAAPA